MFDILKTVGRKRLSSGKTLSVVLVRCVTCGNEQEILRQNALKSNREKRNHCKECISTLFHGMTNTRIWRIWHGMKRRSHDKDDRNYAGRGITVCREWEIFSKFYEDMSEGYADHLTIDRIDVDRPYQKDNCRWATNMEQQANKRTNRKVVIDGETTHLAELVRRSGFSKMMLSMRLNRGMSADEAVADCHKSRYGESQSMINVKRRGKRMSTISSIVDHDIGS